SWSIMLSMEIHEALEAALDEIVGVQGTDLLLSVGSPPIIRLDGALRPVEGAKVIDEDVMAEYLADLLDDDQRHDFEHKRDEDFAFSYDIHRFRGNAFYQRGLPAVALRLIQSQIPSFDQIGLPLAARELISLKQGLILFCGPTGSGKSTTMATMIDAINMT